MSTSRTAARAVARLTVLTMLALSPVALVACGSDTPAEQGTSEGGEALTGTVAPGTSAPRSSSTTSTSSTSPATPSVPGAVTFVDPDGTYSIEVSPTWTESSGTVVAEVEAWLIGSRSDTFADNVNVLTQSTQGRDLQEYLDFSEANLGGMQLIGSELVTGAAGNQLAVIEYTGALGPAGTELHAYATVAVSGGTAAVATLTAQPERFEQALAEVRPYLLTLQRTGA